MADYEELIGAKFSFGDSLDQALAQYDRFIKSLNDKGVQVQVGVSGGALDGIMQQLQQVRGELSSLATSWKEVFGTGSDAAQASAKDIKASVADAESAFISSQGKQTEAAKSQSQARIDIAKQEAEAIRRTQEDLKAKSPVNAEVSRYGSQFFQAELQRLEAAKQAQLKARVEDPFAGAQAYGSGVVQKELDRLQKEQESVEAERQRRLKAPTRDPLEGAGAYGSQFVANEIKKLEEQKLNSGVGGFFRGVGKGIAPQGDSSAASIGEFVGQAARFVAAYAAIREAAEAAGAAIRAPFDIIKDGIQYLTKFQESASEIKSTLLDHGFFSKDPEENLLAAGEAADKLAIKVENLADKLNVKPETIQAAFNTFSDYGGNGLTGSLSDSVDLAGYATAALQSQNPRIQQRTVATQLQKLTSGDLKDTDKLPAALGISADKLNEMVEHARTAHDLLQQIEANAPGLADRLGTANDRLAPLEDTLQRIKERLEGILSENVVQILTDSAKELVGWLDQNRDSLEGIASALGKIAGTTLSTLIDSFKQLLPIIAPLAKMLASGIGDTAEGVGFGAKAGLSLLQNGGLNYSSAVDIGNAASDSQDRLNKLHGALYADPVLGGPTPAALQAPTAPEDVYTNTTPTPPKKPTGNPQRDRIGEIRNAYETQVEAIKKGGQAVRDAVEEDARAFRISLTTAADLKRTSFDNETAQLVAAGAKAQAELAKVTGGKDPRAINNAKDALIRTITGNSDTAANAGTKGEQRDDDAVTKQNREVDQANSSASDSREVSALEYAFSVREGYNQKQLISNAEFLKEEQAYWDKRYQIEIDGAKKLADAIPDNDKVNKAHAQQRVADLQQAQSQQNQTIQRARVESPYDTGAREDQQQVERTQAVLQQAQIKTDVDRHAGLVDTARRDNDAINKANQDVLFAQQQQAVGELTRARAEATQANPNLTQDQISALPGVQEKQLKVSSISAQLIKAQQMDVSTQGISSEEAADRLFGAGSTNGHFQGEKGGEFGDLAQTVDSLGNAAKAVSKGVAAVEQGYQQGGAGGAVGAGLQQIGQFLPGLPGQIVSGIGSIISTVSSLFTQAAQEIGKQVGLAVDKAMEKYSTGQATLNQTLVTVQQQYNELVSKETGRKGGQQVLDTEGLQLKDQIDALKQQQQQAEESFADQTIVAGGTNSVASQWLQTWIDVNKQVQEYQNAVGSGASTQLVDQYLNEELDQERKSLQDQYVQGQQQAVSDALQYNQLLQQRNNYEDQYRQQVFQLQSQDSLARRGNPAEETARQITLAKNQYDQQTQQLNFEIDTYKQKVDYETQIFGLAQSTANLQQQALADQAYQLNEQVQQYQTIVALLASITGVTASNGQIPGLSGLGITIPDNFGVNDGSLNPIPGYGAPGTVDNSSTSIIISIPASALPSNANPQDFATAIGNELAYRVRTGSAT